MKEWHLCVECKKKMERCRAVSVDETGDVSWVCRRCWREREYDNYLYAHLEGKRTET